MSDVISLPPEQIEAAIARIKAEKERRLAEKVEAGEIINMPIFIVAGSELRQAPELRGPRRTNWQNCAPLAISERWCSP